MKLQDILQEESLLLESGVRIPKGTTSAKILHHDDFDGIMSAVAIGLQLKKQGISPNKITTDILHDRDEAEDQIKKLSKRDNQMLVVVDFDRFKGAAKDKAKENVDVQSDHHQKNDPDEKNSSKKSVKSEYGSDVLHISSTKAQGFFTGTDLEIMTGIDSAKFGKNVSTNVYLQKELKKLDSPKDKKMRLAIITSSIVGQLVRGKKTVNPGAVQSIIRDVMKSPGVIGFYNSVKKHVDLQKQQSKLLKAYEGKKNGEIDWKAIEDYNENAPKEMKISKDRMGQVKKSSKTGRGEAASEEELGKRNKEGQAGRDLNTDEKGSSSLKSQDTGDADLPPWEFKDKFKPIPQKDKSAAWKDAEAEAKKKAKDKWPSDKESQKKLIVPIWKKKMNDLQKGAPGVARITENISKQTDMKGNRYLAYEDPKIAANIRDFWKFWQMAMRPDYYDKFKNAAKAKGKEFNPEEINLVELGKEAMKKAKDKLFTKEELQKRGFENPEKILSVLNKAFDESYAKSGGHKAITNISLQPIYGETYDKYQQAAKKAKELSKGKSGEKSDKLKRIEKTMQDKAKKFSTLLRNFKEETQNELTNAVQSKISSTKQDLAKKLKESVMKNAGVK